MRIAMTTKPESIPEGSQAGFHADRCTSPVRDLTPLPLVDANAQMLIQELQLHKIELEMQNEELQRIQHELEASWRQIDHLVAERTRELAGAVAELTGEAQRRRQAEAALRAACAEIERLKRQAQSPHDLEDL
jgi:C4-dicarboxylate-specific signal transduction histidine kinase